MCLKKHEISVPIQQEEHTQTLTIKMMCFMFYCDNNLDIINTLDMSIRNRIEAMEQLQAALQTEEDFETMKTELTSIIEGIAKTQRTKDKKLLAFLGGLTMIKENMQWSEGRALFTDINDNGLLYHPRSLIR
jgi:hypothetical protein